MKSKKGQIMGQVFIYIMSALIFALVMIYGYKAISDFIARADQVSEIELSTDLKTSISTIASSQDVKQKSITVPNKFKEMCFVDLEIDPNPPTGSKGLCDPTHEDYNLVICNFWKSGAEQNVFLLPKPSDIKIFVGKIAVGSEGYICIPISNGKVKLRLEGLGDRTSISEWPEV
tara:strand:- start:4606 stop:5127 length:522 start_codon:yes stop_codon:yes gene_type:complete